MLSMLILFMVHTINNPQFTAPTALGNYEQVVRTDYDSVNNITYDTVVVYTVVGQGEPVHVNWMEPIPFTGQPTEANRLAALKLAQIESGTSVIGLQ